MSLDEKNRCVLDTSKKHLLSLEDLDSTAGILYIIKFQ